MPITQFEGKALVFNNGVKDVRQGDTSLVDENKIAHIPEGNVKIDELTIIKNADNELEVPFDNQTIYRDQDGFIKARGGSGESYTAGEHIVIDSENTISAEWPEVSDHKVILCTKVGEGAAGPIGSFTLNQNSDKTITIPIPEQKEYTGGNDIQITSEGVINYTGSGGGSSYTASEGIIIDDDAISVDKEVVPTKTKFLAGWADNNELPITDSFDMTNAVQSDNTWTLTINSSDAGYSDFRDLWYRIVDYRCNKYWGYEWIGGDYITKASYGNVEPFGTTASWYYYDGEEKDELSVYIYTTEGNESFELIIKKNKNDNSFTIEYTNENGAPGVITLEYGTTGILLPAGIEDGYLYNATPTIVKDPNGNAILGPGWTQFVRNYEFDGLLERVNDMSDTVADLDEGQKLEQDMLVSTPIGGYAENEKITANTSLKDILVKLLGLTGTYWKQEGTTLYLRGTAQTGYTEYTGYYATTPGGHPWGANITDVVTETKILLPRNIFNMFYNCTALTSLDVSNWDTSSVTNMPSMFSYCSRLTSLDVSNWDTSSVTDMGNMFNGCTGLTSIDLSGWDTSKVTYMAAMFSYCQNLTTIYVSDKWSTASVPYGQGNQMFSYCRSLVGGANTTYNSNYTDVTYARIDNPPTAPGYLTLKQ